MRRSAAVLATAFATLAISACGGSSTGSSSGGSAPAAYNGKPVTISFWNPFTGREEGVMNSIIANFHKLYPNITVQSRGAISDDNIVAAIRGGSPPDLTMSQSADNLGEYCGTGAWINLGPYIKRDHVDVNVMPPRCAATRSSRRPLRAAGPRRRLRPLLQQDAVRQGGDQLAAHDLHAAHPGRREADPVQLRRLDQGRRLCANELV